MAAVAALAPFASSIAGALTAAATGSATGATPDPDFLTKVVKDLTAWIIAGNSVAPPTRKEDFGPWSLQVVSNYEAIRPRIDDEDFRKVLGY